jgi:hypothetical protein
MMHAWERRAKRLHPTNKKYNLPCNLLKNKYMPTYLPMSPTFCPLPLALAKTGDQQFWK